MKTLLMLIEDGGNKMPLTVNYFKKDHPLDPTAMIVRGEYKESLELTVPKQEWKHNKDHAKALIRESIDRQVTHAIFGAGIVRSLDEEARHLIIGALVRTNMDYVISDTDAKQNTLAYREFKMREQLIYEMRSMKIKGD